MSNPHYAELQGEIDRLAGACTQPAPIPLHKRFTMTAAEMIAEHTGRAEWAGFNGSSDVQARSAILEAATRRREGL